MGSEKTADWYDEYYRQHPDPSPELTAIHDMVADLVIAHDVPSVVDLGCGPGWFIQRLAARGFEGIYVGWDFSTVALDVAEASARARKNGPRVYANYCRSTIDLADAESAWLPPEAIVVAIEVLEHLADDVVTFDRIVPAGRRVVISVPTYDSESHVRWFAETDDVKGRYGVRGVQFTKDRQIYVSGVKVAR